MRNSQQSQLSGKTALVTGGAGFVGSNLSHRLLELEVDSLVIVDNFLSSDPANLPLDDRVQFIQGSIADPAVLSALPKDLDYVWHLACYHGNQSSIANPLADHANNSLTSLMLFEYLSSQNFKVEKVVYSAAGCAVAEKTSEKPEATQEDAPISAFHDSPYSISKIIGELYGNYFYAQLGLPFVRARFQNVYGPREILGAGQWRGTPATVWRNVVPTFIWRALNNLDIDLDNSGLGSRDFIYVGDVVEGLIACAVSGQPGQAYNLASGQETLVRDLADLILDLTASQSKINLLPKRNWDNSVRRFGSTEKSEKALDFRAGVELKSGLSDTIEWTRGQFDLISASVSKHQWFLRN